MASSTSYEVYAFKAGNWNIDSVYDDKEMALYEARVLLDSRHLSAVQVIEEKFDADTGETLSKIIYRARKGDDRKPKAKTPAASSDEKIKAPMPPKKAVDEQAGFIKYVVIMVLSVGAIALAGIVGLVFLIEHFG